VLTAGARQPKTDRAKPLNRVRFYRMAPLEGMNRKRAERGGVCFS
jgi:hypothetical protein